jgi:AmiR/NasT family two-component response regulator
MPRPEVKPFQNSLEALAQIACHGSGAEGYAFFQRNSGTGSLTRVAGGSAVIPESRPDGAPAFIEYALGSDGVASGSLVFSFSSDAHAQQARAQLDRIAATIRTIWAASATENYADLVGRVADLETRLMDSKIADRARGLLTAEAGSDPAEAIARHVDGVLRPTPTRRILEQVLSELEEEIEERRLVAEAKQILQHLHQVSEEQAHTQLRLRSRKSRTRLKLVARQVIEEQRLLRTENA